MTPVMSLFLRCLLAFILVVLLFSLSDFAMADTTPGACAHQSSQSSAP
jgi:hypothetical protein